MRHRKLVPCGASGIASAAALGALAVIAVVASQPQSDSSDAPTPQTLDEFRTAATRVLEEAGVPGAGMALVHRDGVEWEGGLGLGDRERRRPLTADTHFRLGSISKTFVAMALVQMSEDDVIDLDATVEDVAPEVEIENPWYETDPVRVIHLLQHTAGFDDTCLHEMSNVSDPPDRPLADVLKRTAHSRHVRWRPGTRMSYSNPGYAVAGYLLEKLAGEPFEDYITREIFTPLGMHTSSFRLTPADEDRLARGYTGPSGPPTGCPQIVPRPAGNLHSSPREMARFVRMLLNWGELDTAAVIDPEYLGNMERARTTLAASAGLRNQYGSGIFWTLTLPYPMLGHGGGIAGFSSAYAYSPARDVGYVILLNRDGSAAERALERLSSLAIRYLKRDVDPPAKPAVRLDATALAEYEGYYQDANPRNHLFWPFQFLVVGRRVVLDRDELWIEPIVGERVRLIPVSERSFRREHELDATLVFARDKEERMVLTGMHVYAERRPRWQIEMVRVPVLVAVAVILSPLLLGVAWLAHLQRAQPRGFWELKVALLLCPIVLMTPLATLWLTPASQWGAKNAGTIVVFLATLALPALAVIVAALAVAGRRAGASRWLVGYAWAVVVAIVSLTAYLAWHELLGLRLWTH